MAEVAVFGVYFEHLHTGVNGLGKRGARASTPAPRDWAAEKVAGSVTFCDIVRALLCSRLRICQLGASVDPGAPGLDRLQQFPACCSFLRKGPVLISHFADPSRIMLL
jgi:hypothetical protein